MNYLDILKREIAYQRRVYKCKTERFRELMIEYRLYKCFVKIANEYNNIV